MTSFNDSLAKETWALWEVLWYPDDMPVSYDGARTYVVAPDMDSAGSAVSTNRGDIRSVARVGNGGVVVLGAAEDESLRALAQSYLDKAEEDYTWVDPEDIKRLARAVLSK